MNFNNDKVKPVICIETTDINESYVERGHFYQVYSDEEKHLLIDYFNRGFYSVISEQDLKYFKTVTQEQFEKYEEFCNEGDTDQIGKIVNEILGK